MHSQVANAIVLKRLNYGEADRIITLITKENGRQTLIAKGVRRSTSKLAGGIELFSESTIQYIKGKGEVGTLVSTRIIRSYSKIPTNLELSSAGYLIINVIDKLSERSEDGEYYNLLLYGLELLNKGYSPKLCLGYFLSKVLESSGHGINTRHDSTGQGFKEQYNYTYNYDKGAFEVSNNGYGPNVIKVFRVFSSVKEDTARRITGMENDLDSALQLLLQMSNYYLNLKLTYVNSI